jgi:hypothetical protein
LCRKPGISPRPYVERALTFLNRRKIELAKELLGIPTLEYLLFNLLDFAIEFPKNRNQKEYPSQDIH